MRGSVSDLREQPGRRPMNTINSTVIEPTTGVIGDKLAGRVALVTGGTRGIGAAICKSLASQGASVAAGYSGNRDRAEEFVKEFERDFDGPGRASVHQGNVSRPEDCHRVVQEVLDEHGRIDILVNNAGITMDKMAMKMSIEDWNIGQANYAASKAGLLGLTKTLAKEAAFILARGGRLEEDGVGITVNTVTPGFVATEMLENVPEKVLDKIRSQIPVGRLCRPDEIARVVHFLAADASAYITGQVWGVNGGLDM